MTPEEIGKARRLRNALEPMASNVYFAPEVHAEFEASGSGPACPRRRSLVIADPAGYYCSRAACMGQVPGEVVVAAFGVFNPELIIPNVTRGWTIATAAEVLAAREAGATASLDACSAGSRGWRGRRRSSSGPPPPEAWWAVPVRRAALAGGAGHAVGCAVAGRRHRPGAPWRLAHRGLDRGGGRPVEIGLLTEVYYGMPTRRYHRGRGWTLPTSTRARPVAVPRARRRGAAGAERRGRRFRESIEVATDLQQVPILRAIGDDHDELLAILEPWAGLVVAGGGFLTSVEQIPPAGAAWTETPPGQRTAVWSPKNDGIVSAMIFRSSQNDWRSM